MILPIVAYGHPVLKKKAKEVSKDLEKLEELVENMWETMYNASGIGLAAPQIGKGLRMFVVDTVQIMDDGKEADGIKSVFINPEKIIETGELWPYEEGCLSIPNVRAEVVRPSKLRLRYFDEEFEEQTMSLHGLNARVVQHEYDHLDGILFTEYIKPLKRRLVKRKLESIKKGKVDVDYKMKFYSKK